MAFKGDIHALILATLEDRPLHGYQIVKRLRESQSVGKLSEGQIYPHLHRLEATGLLRAEWDTDTGGAPRRVYQITESGTTELAHQRKVWARFAESVSSLLGSSKSLSGAIDA